MKRQIIEIDEELCDGCEQCVEACAEGAIRMVAGKAKLVKEQYCDGLGACLGDCPTGALKIVEREAPEYDAAATEEHVRQLRGEPGVLQMRRSHLQAVSPPAAPAGAHPPAAHLGGGGCPGSRMRMLGQQPGGEAAQPVSGSGLPAKVQASDLAQWPVQLHLVPPQAPFFQDKELLVLATCGPVASADVHWRYLRGRSVVVACPKLDVVDPYVAKLGAIFAANRIPKVVVVILEVPCCSGLTRMVLEAHKRSGRDDLTVEEVVLSLDGSVIRQQPIAGPGAITARRTPPGFALSAR